MSCMFQSQSSHHSSTSSCNNSTSCAVELSAPQVNVHVDLGSISDIHQRADSISDRPLGLPLGETLPLNLEITRGSNANIHSGNGDDSSTSSVDSPIVLKRRSKLNRNRNQQGKGRNGGAFASLQKYLENCHDGTSDDDSDGKGLRSDDGNCGSSANLLIDENTTLNSARSSTPPRTSTSNQNAADHEEGRHRMQDSSQNHFECGTRTCAHDSSPKQAPSKESHSNNYRHSDTPRNKSFRTQFQRTKKKELESLKKSQSQPISFDDEFESRLPTARKRMAKSQSHSQSQSQNPSFGKGIVLDIHSTSHWGRRPQSRPQPISNSSMTPKQSANTPRATSRFSKTRTPLTRAQQLAAATKSSTILRRKTPRSINKNLSSAGTRTPSDESFRSTSWPKFDKQNGKDRGIDHDIVKASFGPSFLNNKKRKRPTMDTVVDDDNCSTDGNLQFRASLDRPVSPSANKNDSYHFTDMKKDAIFATPRPTRIKTSAGSNSLGKSPNSGGSLSTGKRNGQSPQRRKKKIGPLSRMLQSIRGSIEADWVRFGTYPYRPQAERKRDVNDPRNRAESFMDVTILGQPVERRPGNSTSATGTALNSSSNANYMYTYTPDKVVIKGLIHSFVRNESRMKSGRVPRRAKRFRFIASPDLAASAGEVNPTDDSDTNQKDLVSPDTLQVLETTPSYAWLCFTRETFAELGIDDGFQLRVYNARTIDISSFSASKEKTYPFVACTRLCEVYPKDLPTLQAHDPLHANNP